MSTTLTFPLLSRCRSSGILSGKSALIVAPTATGKSFIGRQFIRSHVEPTGALSPV